MKHNLPTQRAFTEGAQVGRKLTEHPMTLTHHDSPRLLESWLFRNGHPYKETRFASAPHECLAICTEGLQASEASALFDLIDWRVSAVCGPFTELQRRKVAR